MLNYLYEYLENTLKREHNGIYSAGQSVYIYIILRIRRFQPTIK